MDNEKVKQLAEEHWKWVEGFMVSVGYELDSIEKSAYHYLYTTAFIHGYKHGAEEQKKGDVWEKIYNTIPDDLNEIK